MTAIDLFCGCGGLTTGLKQAGFTVVGGADIDELALASYGSNHPEIHRWQGDIRELTGNRIAAEVGIAPGELDLLAGCPPCQGFSTLRTMNGGRTISESQNELIFEFLRLVDELRPKSIMLENVPGLANDSRLQRFVAHLNIAGYAVTHDVLNAADYGVPQRRRRFILLASRAGRIPFANKCSEPRTVRDAIKHLPRPRDSKDVLHRLTCAHSTKVKNLIARIPVNGGSRSDIGEQELLECHKRTKGFYDVYGRMEWDAPSPTITTGCVNPSRGRFLHPRQHRAITLREAALLQSFPPDYRFPLTLGKYAAARLIGNALPPEFIRRHALSVREHLDRTRE